jgi:hypothetical protein
MSSQLEILSQVLLSLTTKQKKVMHNINVLLSNRDSEVDLFDKIEHELGELSSIHGKMQECESFMLQLAQSKIKNNEDKTGEDLDKNQSEK